MGSLEKEDERLSVFEQQHHMGVVRILTFFDVVILYVNFVVGYESGITMEEIAKRNNVSQRTIYRYKAYYDKIKEKWI